MVDVKTVRIPVSQATRDKFRHTTNNVFTWPDLMTQLIISSSAVWGRVKPEVNTLVLARIEQVRLDQRLLFRFVVADTKEDLHLAMVQIEHGSERLATAMVHDSMPIMVTAKGIYGVPGQTKPHCGFAVASLKGILPQARTLVLHLEVPKGAGQHVFGSVEPVRDTEESGEVVPFSHERRYPTRGDSGLGFDHLRRRRFYRE